MFSLPYRFPGLPALMTAAIALCVPVSGTLHAGPVTEVKDSGPVNAHCDQFLKHAGQWRVCIGNPTSARPSPELFYAGYWLARNGKYKDALRFLTKADRTDPRVLTYMAFSLRHLGRVGRAFHYYREALLLNPDYHVARAYLGEAHLATREASKAKAELAEIAERCGTQCAEYLDLAGHIDTYEQGRRKPS